MLRTRRPSALYALVLGVIVLPGPAWAQEAGRPGALSEIPLPGGLRGTLAAINDRAAPDRSRFLLEFIRRVYYTPLAEKNDPRDVLLRSLFAQLDVASRPGDARTGPAETLPLPLPAAIWIDVVFGGRATPQTLVGAILRSRSASLLYCGLLSLDDGTRAWLATRPDLIAELASRRAAAFVVAAPGLRVTDARARVPGGDLAEPAWETLVGSPVRAPADFIRALLAHEEGRLAAFFGVMAQLTPAQIRLALNLESSDVAARVAAARRLYAIFERIAPGWNPEEQVFSRPVLDPALLVAGLRVDDRGQPSLPGTRRFWSAVLADASDSRKGPKGKEEGDLRALAEGDPVDFVWLCEQVFTGRAEQSRRYQIVLFASRIVRRLTPETARDAVEAVRAAGTYPALVAVLERAGLADLAAFASAARRAARLSAIGDEERAARALAQFQGTLALVTRAAMRGSLSAAALSTVVSSLSAVDIGEHGDYEGRLVGWMDEFLRDQPAPAPSAPGDVDDNAAGPMERVLLRVLAGPVVAEPPIVEWEGTRYRLDLARAETMRLARLLGDDPRPYLSSARTVVAVADALNETALTREQLRQEADALARVSRSLGWESADAATPDEGPPRASSKGGAWDGGRYRELEAAVRRAAREGDVRSASRLAPALRVLADDLLASGLLELVYAVALGQSDRVFISARDVASRHDFGFRPAGVPRPGPWQLPLAGSDMLRGWRVTGSLLGMDVKLADFSLTRLSSKPPPRKPTLNEMDRRVFTEMVALVEPASLVDADRDTIVAAIRNGRAKLAAVRTPLEAVALADQIPLSPTQRTLLAWVVAYEPERVAVFLSPSELLWLGLDRAPVGARLDAWGADAEPRLGCLCLQLIERRPWEMLAGRWHSGVLASGFPDLNLRLAELLAELRMPAPLLGPVLASATLDFVNTATSRYFDDRRGLVEFVQALGVERIEQYLALLTTDGPLVPLSEGVVDAAGTSSGGRR